MPLLITGVVSLDDDDDVVGALDAFGEGDLVLLPLIFGGEEVLLLLSGDRLTTEPGLLWDLSLLS